MSDLYIFWTSLDEEKFVCVVGLPTCNLLLNVCDKPIIFHLRKEPLRTQIVMSYEYEVLSEITKGKVQQYYAEDMFYMQVCYWNAH